MNETLEVIKSRRSIRKYKAEQVQDSELQAILECALYAPSAMNQQKWHFTVIQDKRVLKRMCDIMKEDMMRSGNERLVARAGAAGFSPFHNAPTLVLISADPKGRFIEIDCGAAAENIALAAEALNIGSCLMTSPGTLFVSAEGGELKKELGIPEGYGYVCTVALGYKDCENPVPQPRKMDLVNYVK